jgi:hypothetical protein
MVKAREVHNLAPEKAALAYPVRLRAVVTYYDPYIDVRHGALFVHDESGGVFVSVPAHPILPLEPGTLVEITGAAKIVASASRPVAIESAGAAINVSIGVVTFPEGGSEADSLIQRADEAMYAAKDKGRNGFQVYPPNLVSRKGGDRRLLQPVPECPLL